MQISRAFWPRVLLMLSTDSRKAASEIFSHSSNGLRTASEAVFSRPESS